MCEDNSCWNCKHAVNSELKLSVILKHVIKYIMALFVDLLLLMITMNFIRQSVFYCL